MSGVKWLYISTENKIYKVPNPKNGKFKEIKELSEQDVLKVMLYYKTKNRRPDKLVMLEFDRITLDSEGVYELTDERQSKVLQSAFQYINNRPQELADNKSPFELPLVPKVPSNNEKIALYEYLNKKFPNLGKDAPAIVEKVRPNSEKMYANPNNDQVLQ
ncbi:hypothetical protein ACQKM9_20705 [Viridibacillus sp. NPDC093762]|uniref:hypothetical protein n=1 Tax=Viridibacillus sp. NPDC093762 TaxID=3390720 RepID=UPI003CFE11E1